MDQKQKINAKITEAADHKLKYDTLQAKYTELQQTLEGEHSIFIIENIIEFNLISCFLCYSRKRKRI